MIERHLTSTLDDLTSSTWSELFGFHSNPFEQNESDLALESNWSQVYYGN